MGLRDDAVPPGIAKTDTLGNGLGDACDLELVIQRTTQLEADIQDLQTQVTNQQNQITDLTIRLDTTQSEIDGHQHGYMTGSGPGHNTELVSTQAPPAP